jgi:long-chain acyl-CoA synthetase
VAVVDQGGPLAVASILAAARLGAAAAQMNPDLKVGEMAALCRLVGCTVGIAGAGYADKLREALGGPVLTRSDMADADAEGPPRHTPIEDDSTGLVLFSSGSTGLPKPVYIRHRNVGDRLTNYGTAAALEVDPRVDMISVPLFHIGGTLGLLITLYSRPSSSRASMPGHG